MSSKRQKRVWSTAGLIGNFLCVAAGATVSVLALRKNNLMMVELYKKVEKADESGVGTYDRLKDLQMFVSRHMNATPPKLGTNPGIQLKNTYERAKKTEAERVTSERARMYNEAIDYCEAALPKSLLSDRAQCIIDRNGSQMVTENTIIADLYRYDFSSPRWSPDLAGWSIVVTATLLVLFVLQLITRMIARVLISK
jgi:hypothetical protein